MSSELKIIDLFLEAFSPEVGGRSAERLTEKTETQLRQLGAGELPAEERADLSRELLNNPAAVTYLLSQVGRG